MQTAEKLSYSRRRKKYVPGWVGGWWVGGWMGGKAVLRDCSPQSNNENNKVKGGICFTSLNILFHPVFKSIANIICATLKAWYLECKIFLIFWRCAGLSQIAQYQKNSRKIWNFPVSKIWYPLLPVLNFSWPIGNQPIVSIHTVPIQTGIPGKRYLSLEVSSRSWGNGKSLKSRPVQFQGQSPTRTQTPNEWNFSF